jgi:hypothetical protein
MDYYKEYVEGRDATADLFFYCDPMLRAMTLGAIHSAGYDDGYTAGIDRGMELQREADAQLRKEELLDES